MRTMTILVLPIASALLLSGCAHNAQHADAADPVGCWYFERDDAASTLNLPWGIGLDSSALTGWPALDRRGGARVARTLHAAGPAEHPFGYWLQVGDSVEVGHPGGGGLLLTLEPGAAVMTGTARPIGDVVAPGSARRSSFAVRLTRAQCPAY